MNHTRHLAISIENGQFYTWLTYKLSFYPGLSDASIKSNYPDPGHMVTWYSCLGCPRLSRHHQDSPGSIITHIWRGFNELAKKSCRPSLFKQNIKDWVALTSLFYKSLLLFSNRSLVCLLLIKSWVGLQDLLLQSKSMGGHLCAKRLQKISHRIWYINEASRLGD